MENREWDLITVCYVAAGSQEAWSVQDRPKSCTIDDTMLLQSLANYVPNYNPLMLLFPLNNHHIVMD